jgi:hypothetical protein
MASQDRVLDALSGVAEPLLEIVERVSKYPQLTQAQIDEKVAGPITGRNYDLYPDPFPRDGSILLPPEWQELQDVSEKIGAFFPGRTSTAYASAVLQFAIQGCLSKEDIKDRLRHLASAVKYLAGFDQEWMFIYPVENLVLQVGKLRVGPVQFHPTTEGDSFLRWRKRDMRSRFPDTPFLTALQPAPGWLDPLSTCDAWASVRARGDQILAEERASKVVAEAIDIIRLFVARSETVALRGSVNFGLGGQAAGGHIEVGFRRSRVNSTATRTRTFETLKKEHRYGPAATYKAVITSDTLERMRQGGLDALSRALESTKRSKLEERVFRALGWFSEAVSSPYEIDRYLKLVFAMDALLGGGPKGEGTTTDIGERAAFILDRTVKGRRAVKKEVVHHFHLRHAYAHGDRKAVSSRDLFWAELNCAVLIRSFVVDHMSRQSFDAFLQWVEEQKFSAAG